MEMIFHGKKEKRESVPIGNGRYLIAVGHGVIPMFGLRLVKKTNNPRECGITTIIEGTYHGTPVAITFSDDYSLIVFDGAINYSFTIYRL